MTATNNLLEKLSLQDKRVAVAGLFRTRSGLQRGAQLMLLDLRRRGYTVNAIDLSSSLYYALDETDAGLLSPCDLERLSVRELIIHINPPLFEAALDAFPPAVLNHVRVTGYWAWELTVLSDEWRDCAKRCSAIWAPSPFLAKTFAAELPDFTGEIAVIPHQVDLAPPPELNPEERLRLRQRHDLEPTQFVCGTNFAFLSNYARKNPMGAIDAFTQAFPPEDRAARLLVRTHDSERYPELLRLL
jgi:hypothetical protein